MKIKSEVDEISALGGMTRLVTRRASSSSSVVSASSPTSTTITRNFNYSPDSQSPGGIGEPSEESYVGLHDTTGMAAGSAWQNYTHVHNFNINMGMTGEYYPGNGVGMVTMSPTSEGPMAGEEEGVADGVGYPMQETTVHHHRQPQHHLQQHPLSTEGQGTSSGIGMALDTSGLGSSSTAPAPEETYYMPFYGASAGARSAIGYGQTHYFGTNPQTQQQQQLMQQQGMVLHMQERQSPADLNDSWQNFMAQYKS